MKKLLVLICACLLTSCYRQTISTPVFRSAYMPNPTTVDVNTAPFAGYAYTGNWHAGTPNYYDTTINAMDGD